MPLLKQTTFICLDCETTGLDPQSDHIIELAAVRFTLDENLAAHETLVNPGCPIPEESIAIHHITDDMVADKPTIVETLPPFLDFVGRNPIVGHGVGFDLDIIAASAERTSIPCTLKTRPHIDTLRLARHYGDSPKNSLVELANHFNIPLEGAHRAMQDVLMNVAVFKHLVSRFRTTEELFTLLSKPIRMKFMPLGKHKGRPFDEIPLPYLKWASHMDFDQDLLYSIRYELKKRKKGGSFSQTTNPFSEL